MKMSVVYHSVSGNTRAMAEIIVQGMEQVEGVEARAFSIDAVDEDWLRESVCLVAGSPTYYASVSGAMKLFLEKLGKYGVAGKLGGAFATANYIHGGAELAMPDHPGPHAGLWDDGLLRRRFPGKAGDPPGAPGGGRPAGGDGGDFPALWAAHGHKGGRAV